MNILFIPNAREGDLFGKRNDWRFYCFKRNINTYTGNGNLLTRF